jgi:hypothetical protein
VDWALAGATLKATTAIAESRAASFCAAGNFTVIASSSLQPVWKWRVATSDLRPS